MIFNDKNVNYVKSRNRREYTDDGRLILEWSCNGCDRYGSLALFSNGEGASCAICQSCVTQLLDGFKEESKIVVDKNKRSDA